MSDLLSTPISISFAHRDGHRQPLGAGSIDAMGMIRIDTFHPGQDEYLGALVSELNARENIILKEPPAAGANRFSITKRKVLRADPEFLAEFAHYCARIYSLEVTFDASVFVVPDPDAPLGRTLPDAPAPHQTSIGRPSVVRQAGTEPNRFAPAAPDDEAVDEVGDEIDDFADDTTELVADGRAFNEPEPDPRP